ncbi:hypothetical protein B0H16DRAFT_952762 [Mycena metata]|uniref:Arrestin C-terminal-like domain-containing protein n=1 Tax=Mycena metata TaxID=1033252 RepID=A0AAD7K390_9AGAR|nr:hypothetical protein B0H16DRAFT_952762 [Mycena metata]
MHFFRTKSGPVEEFYHDSSQRMEIVLDNEYLFLRGTGVDVEPARLSGNIVLHLNEPTTIRSITLQFRGKAYLPVPPRDSSSSSNPPSTYILCKHNWSFLEGQKKQSHTLKAGRHLFPFQLQVGGSLPCSIVTDAFGGASVTYKLRATAQRTGFSHNLSAVAPVFLIRSLGPTALEYQQTRDIEHLWSDKLMFSVAIPHTAWPAGDGFVALLKISPLVKGVGVLTVTTSLRETTKAFGRPNSVTRTVATVTHEIVGGRAVEFVDKGKHPLRPSATEAGPSSAPNPTPPTDPAQSENYVVTSLPMHIPSHLTPSHQLDPIKITHSIHWSVIVTNVDGHLSELFCSLAVTLLDSQLLSEARTHTRLARQLLIGGPESQPERQDSNELPSYVAHVRDRVANMFLSEDNTMRVTNPWIKCGVNPILVGGAKSKSALISATNCRYTLVSERPLFFDWVNAEFLISQGATRIPRAEDTVDPDGTHTPGAPGADHPPASLTPAADGIATYTHATNASHALAGLFVAQMEPTSVLTHPHWLTARSDPKDPRASSVDLQRRVREVTVPMPETTSVLLLHRAFTEVPDYEVALRGFLGGVPPLSSMQDLPSYDEASRRGTPDLFAKRAPDESTAGPTS